MLFYQYQPASRTSYGHIKTIATTLGAVYVYDHYFHYTTEKMLNLKGIQHNMIVLLNASLLLKLYNQFQTRLNHQPDGALVTYFAAVLAQSYQQTDGE